MKEVIEKLVEKSKEAISKNDNDYIGDDGLLYCGKCNTKKQTRIYISGMCLTPMCLCECASRRFAEEEQARKEEERQKRIEELKRKGFPDARMRAWTFEADDNSNPKLVSILQNYVDNFRELKSQGRGLLLYGPCGTGKTFAACEVANALIEKGYKVLVTNFSMLINSLQSTFEKQQLIDDLNEYSLLVIDDLGIERNTEYAKEQVFNIIDSRYRSGLPMIITTNLSIDNIKKPNDIESGRIYDRIIEICFPIEFKGKSKRREKVCADYDKIKDILGA